MTGYIVGVDGSGPGDAALKWAVARAADDGEPVLLAHVVEDEWGLAGSDFAREAVFAGERIVESAFERAKTWEPTVDLTTRVLHGSPVWELAALGDADDTLVIGTHKTGFLHGRVLGSRSVSISALAGCPVVIVPDGRGSMRHGVVVGVTGPGEPFVGVAAAAAEAARLRQPLTLLHAAPAHNDTGNVVVADGSVARERQAAMLRAAVAAASAVSSQLVVYTRVSTRPPAEALLDASRDAILLVLEPSRTGGPTTSVVGSTTHDVLMNINSPVLVAR